MSVLEFSILTRTAALPGRVQCSPAVSLRVLVSAPKPAARGVFPR
jgi:hypothetical protein